LPVFRGEIKELPSAGTARQCEAGTAQELGVRVVRDGHVIEVGHSQVGLVHAVTNCVGGKRGVVPHSGEPFLLGRGDQFAVHDECRRSIPVEGVEAEDDHAWHHSPVHAVAAKGICIKEMPR